LEITGKETRFGILTELFETYVGREADTKPLRSRASVEVSPLAKRITIHLITQTDLNVSIRQEWPTHQQLNDPLAQRERFH
jgi:lysyl-tRNA synthetase class II